MAKNKGKLPPSELEGVIDHITDRLSEIVDAESDRQEFIFLTPEAATGKIFSSYLTDPQFMCNAVLHLLCELSIEHASIVLEHYAMICEAEANAVEDSPQATEAASDTVH